MKVKIKTIDIWPILLCIGIIGNLVLNAIYNMGQGDIVTYNVLLWTFLMWGSLITNHRSISGKLFKLIFIVMLCGIIGNIHGALLVTDGMSSLDNMVINFATIIIFVAMKGEKISRDSLNAIMKTLVICGIAASLYAMIMQSMYLVYVLKRLDVAYNSWFYTSFLGQRNIFAGYCFLSSIAALYLFSNKSMAKNKIYLAAVILFGIQIFITNSRTAFISYLALILLYIYLKKKKKTKFLLITISIIGAVILLQNEIFNSVLNTFFIHTTSSGTDSGSIRLNMWREAIGYSFEKIGFIFGFGIYPMSVILLDNFGYASTHNAYLDTFMTGGMVYVFIIIYIYYRSFKKIKKCTDKHYSMFMISALIAFLLYNTTEAGMALFTQNYFSITATILFVIIPMGYNGENIEENKKRIKVKG